MRQHVTVWKRDEGTKAQPRLALVIVTVILAVGLLALSSCSNPTATVTEKFYYELTATGASEATGVSYLDGSGDTVAGGTLSLPWTSSTYTASCTGTNCSVNSPEISGTFVGSGSITGTVTITSQTTTDGQQQGWISSPTDVNGTGSVPFQVQ